MLAGTNASLMVLWKALARVRVASSKDPKLGWIYDVGDWQVLGSFLSDRRIGFGILSTAADPFFSCSESTDLALLGA